MDRGIQKEMKQKASLIKMRKKTPSGFDSRNVGTIRKVKWSFPMHLNKDLCMSLSLLGSLENGAQSKVCGIILCANTSEEQE